MENGLKSWKSVRGCSVEVEESTEEPASLAETIVMTQVRAKCGRHIKGSPIPHEARVVVRVLTINKPP